MKRTLIVVEPLFLTQHVGVRRVVLHLADTLREVGVEVEWAVAKDSHLHRVMLETGSDGARTLELCGELAEPSAYDKVILSNPWLVATGLPPLSNVVGIVYDMVPNLIALGYLPFSISDEVFPFACAHSIGYDYYINHARRIVCISNSTRRDFLRLYRAPGLGDRVVTYIPFPKTRGPQAPRKLGSNRVLLVNVLDERKNITGILKVLTRASSLTAFVVDIVGRPRMQRSAMVRFFTGLSDAGIAYEWQEEASEAVLSGLYQQAQVLFFPSLYEGLGLPVLEAQAAGVPVITSDTSSLPEVNLNPTLCLRPADLDGMAEAIRQLVDEVPNANLLAGTRLQEAQHVYLSALDDFPALIGF